MKKVINISLGGIVFAIEEDAHGILVSYLKNIEASLAETDDLKEVTADIESAIAEKFIAAGRSEKHAIGKDDVERIVREMGTASDFAEAGRGESKASEATKGREARRRLFRDTDNSVIGGVASGLGAYFDIDPVIIRILFVASLFLNGLGAIVYILLWIIVPEAMTTSDRFAMRGKKVTVSHITERVKKKLGEFDEEHPVLRRGAWERVRGILSQLFEVMGLIVRFLIKALRYLVGIVLIVFGSLGIAAIVASSIAVTTGNALVTFDPLAQELIRELFTNSPEGMLFLVSAVLVPVIPIIYMIVLGTSLLRNRNMFTLASTLALFILWIIAIMTAAIMTAHYAPVIMLYQNNGGTAACTLEAKLCPDGSIVGRTGPSCEFAACPGE